MNKRKLGEKNYHYAVKISANLPLSASCVYYVSSHDNKLSTEQFNGLKRLCDSKIDLFETVKITIANREYLMLLDEEGKIKRLPQNTIATALYNNPYDVVVGDVFIVKFDGIEDIELLDDRDLDNINEIFEFCYAKVGTWLGLPEKSLDTELANLRA